jgi:hypothetical protein
MTQTIQTIDVAGVRAIVSAIGHRRAHRIIRKATTGDAQRTPTTLKCLGEEDNYRRPGITCRNGHATILHCMVEPRWWMEAGRISTRGVNLPETAISALLGKPITALIRHPMLDDAMTVQETRGAAKGLVLMLTHTMRPIEDVLESLNRLEMP